MINKIKLFDPYVDSNENEEIDKVFHSNFWASGAGVGKVLEFEEKFCRYTKASSCVAVNSGTAALHLALSLLDIKGKEVILPSLSFVATAHAVLYNGGIPIFADIKEDTLCIDPEKIDKKITKKTKIILPVHFGGFPCDLDEISRLCEQHKITLMEDAAHAAGTTYKNRRIGGHGSAVCFSFHPTKNLAMPTGGAITLNDKQNKKYKKILNSKRWCGITNRKGVKYDVKNLGWNYYMNEFSAAIGLAQLKKLDSMNNKRKEIAKRYSNEIELEEKMGFFKNCSYHLYWIQVKKRDRFMKKMKDNGIETGIHYIPIHKMHLYKGSRLPITEKISKNIVSIPIHPNLSESDVDKIIKLINQLTK